MQGQDADCYWITATSDAAHTGRMGDVFLTQNFNKAGIQAVKLYIRGLPTIVVVDDYLPYYNGGLIMNRQPPDGDYWGIILEKAWAKVNGNYENINYGWQVESFYHLTGAPGKQVTFQSIGYNVDAAWNEITDAVRNNYLVGVDTAASAKFSLPGSHAYSLIGAYELKDTAGKVVHRLYRVRNPWGTDVYNGPWADGSNLWTDAFKAQVPYARNTNDGAFFIADSDLVTAFNYYEIGYVHDNWAKSYYSKTSADNGLASYTFTTKKDQEVFLVTALYDYRMYPSRCKSFLTQGKLYLY